MYKPEYKIGFGVIIIKVVLQDLLMCVSSSRSNAVETLISKLKHEENYWIKMDFYSELLIHKSFFFRSDLFMKADTIYM